MKVNAATTIQTGMTVETLIKILEGIPKDATVYASVYEGAMPWDSAQYKLNFSWEA